MFISRIPIIIVSNSCHRFAIKASINLHNKNKVTGLSYIRINFSI